MKTISALFVASLFGSLSHADPTNQVVTVLGEFPQRPGNPAVGPDGTVYFSMHPFDNPEFSVMRLENGAAVPYPSEAMSRDFGSVIGIQATQDGSVWMLDMGSEDLSPKLVGWDSETDQLKAVYTVPREARVPNSFLQDFAIDEKRQKAFLADMSRGGLIDASEPAIVVIDLQTGDTRRVLSGDPVFQPSETPIIAEGKEMQMRDTDGTVHPIKLGLNPIAIDPENEWIYFGPMTPGNLYRVPAAVLGDFSQPEEVIRDSIEIYAEKPSSDGIAAGKNGVVYITNVDESRIDAADGGGTNPWAVDDRLIWPDAIAIGPDGKAVVVANQLNRAAVFNDGQSLAEPPYLILEISDN
ncbi:MAG: L-dopachrome tautomerase-related protein [Verrucomicrobiota bacterium]